MFIFYFATVSPSSIGWSPWNFVTWSISGLFYNARPKIRGLSHKKIWGQNMQNLHPFYTTSDFDHEYLRNETRYPKSERHDREQFLPRSAKYVRWTLVHYPESRTWIWTHPNQLFQETIFWPLGGTGPEIFTRARHWPRLASAHHKLGRGSLHLKLGLNSTYARL